MGKKGKAKRRNAKIETQQNYTRNTNKTKGTVSYFGTALKYVTPPYEYKGRKNETDFPEFIELCKKSQDELKKMLPNKLVEAGYTDVFVGDGYIYAKGEMPILLTAHMDTVHKSLIKDFYENIDEKGNHVIASPQGIGGDDRCGIYMILEVIKNFKPYVLFCEDEEIGCVGSRKFCNTNHIFELAELHYLIGLDRAGNKDAVFYDCANDDFTDFITEVTGYHEEMGSYSDISQLAPACGVAAVNLSCGYYNAHTTREEVVMEEMLHTIEVVQTLLSVESDDSPQYEYVEAVPYYGYNGCDTLMTSADTLYGKYGADYDQYFDDEQTGLYVSYLDRVNNNNECFDMLFGRSVEHAWYKFFRNHPETCWNDVIDYYCN